MRARFYGKGQISGTKTCMATVRVRRVILLKQKQGEFPKILSSFSYRKEDVSLTVTIITP